MSEQNWEVIEKVSGELQGELLRGLFEAQGIPVTLNQEGAGRAYGIGVGALGLVQILVPSNYAAEARQVLEQYYAGDFEADEAPDEPEVSAED